MKAGITYCIDGLNISLTEVYRFDVNNSKIKSSGVAGNEKENKWTVGSKYTFLHGKLCEWIFHTS